MAIYYVKNGGNDTLDGLNDANAWETVDQVNASSFNAGDQILFKRGSTWAEELTPPSSGTAGSHIILGTYDTGAKPIIRAVIGAGSRIGLTFQDLDVSTNGDGRGFSFESSNSDITISRCDVHGHFNYGITFWAAVAGDNIIEDCNVYDNGSDTGVGEAHYSSGVFFHSSAGATITIRRNDIYNNGYGGDLGYCHGIYIDTPTVSDNINIYENTVHGNVKGHGIVSKGGGHIYKNKSYDNANGGISFSNSDTVDATFWIWGNILWNNGTVANSSDIYGIYSPAGKTYNVYIYNNTIYATMHGIWFLASCDCTNLEIKNNIIYVASAAKLALYSEPVHTSAVIDNNCYYRAAAGNILAWEDASKSWAQWQALGLDTNGLNEDPLLTDPGSNVFTLQALSPCKDTGETLSADYDEDYLGTSRPQGAGWDMGAYEYDAGVGSKLAMFFL